MGESHLDNIEAKLEPILQNLSQSKTTNQHTKLEHFALADVSKLANLSEGCSNQSRSQSALLVGHHHSYGASGSS